MYKPRGASITILTLLAVSSDFHFDLPQPRESSSSVKPAPAARPGAQVRQPSYTAPRQIQGPRTHPDWVRTSAVSTDATGTRNFFRAPRRSGGFADGEIPM